MKIDHERPFFFGILGSLAILFLLRLAWLPTSLGFLALRILRRLSLL